MRRVPQNDAAKRLIWVGLLAGLGAVATAATSRLATAIWRSLYGEDPPE